VNTADVVSITASASAAVSACTVCRRTADVSRDARQVRWHGQITYVDREVKFKLT